jgi:uncharacterized protein YbjT (DUF2867 family)
VLSRFLAGEPVRLPFSPRDEIPLADGAEAALRDAPGDEYEPILVMQESRPVGEVMASHYQYAQQLLSLGVPYTGTLDNEHNLHIHIADA